MEKIDGYDFFLKLICAQKYIVICFIFSLFFAAGAVVIFSYTGFSTDVFVIPLFVALLLLYIAVYSSVNLYNIFRLFSTLKRENIKYDIKEVDALVYQEPMRLRSMRSNNMNILVPSQKRKAVAIRTKVFVIIFIWYKEVGAYKKLSKPLWIELGSEGGSSISSKLKGLRRLNKDELTYSDNNLQITPSQTKKDFKQIVLVDFLCFVQKE